MLVSGEIGIEGEIKGREADQLPEIAGRVPNDLPFTCGGESGEKSKKGAFAATIGAKHSKNLAL